jgi:hypothetical protein
MLQSRNTTCRKEGLEARKGTAGAGLVAIKPATKALVTTTVAVITAPNWLDIVITPSPEILHARATIAAICLPL